MIGRHGSWIDRSGLTNSFQKTSTKQKARQMAIDVRKSRIRAVIGIDVSVQAKNVGLARVTMRDSNQLVGIALVVPLIESEGRAGWASARGEHGGAQ